MIKEIINSIKKIKGLANVNQISTDLKRDILKLEDKNNSGVFQCLKRKHTIALTHDHSFREPEGEIIVKRSNKIIFPGISFSEVKAKNVVSSSPSKKVHELLVKKFSLKLKDDATLLIGFD